MPANNITIAIYAIYLCKHLIILIYVWGSTFNQLLYL